MESRIITAEYQQATELHGRIMANAEIVAGSLLEMCQGLKEMRDKKLYLQFDIPTFEEYCETKVGIKARWAYSHISAYEKLGSTVLQSNANLGITKLELIAQLPALERAEELANHTFDGMSVREIRELVRNSKEQSEQLSLLMAENQNNQQRAEKAEQQYFDLLAQQKNQQIETENRIAQLNRQIKELEARPIEVAVIEPSKEDIEKLRKKIKAEMKSESITQADVDKAVIKAVQEERQKTELSTRKQIEKLKAEKEEYRQKAEISENKVAQLQQKLRIADPSKSKAFMYFENLQKEYNSMIGAIDEMATDEDKTKFRKAVKKSLYILIENLE